MIAPGLLGVGPGAHPELVVGRWQPELLEEDLGELAVVVLARVDQDLLRGLAQVPRDGRRLDELGPVPDHRQHAPVRASSSRPVAAGPPRSECGGRAE